MIFNTLKRYFHPKVEIPSEHPEIVLDLSGIYWSFTGSDHRLLNSYNYLRIENVGKDHAYLSLMNTRLDTPYLYSGSMARTSYLFDLSVPMVFNFDVKIPRAKNVKTALWFKSINSDIDEVDIFECFNHKVYPFDLLKIIFTGHSGRDYDIDHQMHATSLLSKREFKVTFTTGDTFRWYLNGRLVKSFKNNITKPCVLMADIGVDGIPVNFDTHHMNLNF